MPKIKRDKSSSDSDSGPEDRNPAPSKKSKAVSSKAAAGASTGAGDEEPSWSLDKKRMAKVRTFKGKTYIDIREYYDDSNGDTKPGKKGISLSVGQWQKLKACMGEIDEAIKNA